MQPIRRISVKASWIFLAVLLAAGSAAAQLHKWVDKDGKVRYGDTPPPGAKTSSIKGTAPDMAFAPSSKDAKKGPLTPAEKGQDDRLPKADARKDAESAEAGPKDKAAESAGCTRAREQLRTLESGQRVARTNPSGEQYFLQENQVAREATKARQAMQKACK